MPLCIGRNVRTESVSQKLLLCPLSSLVRTAVKLLFAAATVVIAFGQMQQSPQQADSTAPQSGLQVTSLSGYTGYYSDSLSTNPGSTPVAAPLGSDVQIGGSLALRWARDQERSNFVLTYNMDYSSYVRLSSLSSLNHRLSFTTGRHLTPRWDLQFSGGANIITTDQLLFLPIPDTGIGPASLNGTPTGGIVNGIVTSPVAPVLTGAQAVISPSLLVYGQRTLSSVAQISLIHTISSRTSISFTAGAIRNQGLDPSNAANTTAAVMPQTTTSTVGFQISHSINPRTDISITVNGNRTFERFEDAYYETTRISINRLLSRRWFGGVYAGGGLIQGVGRDTYVATGPQYLAGAKLGFHTYEHSFSASVDRNVAESYGFGPNVTLSIVGAWNWARPGRPWWVGFTANDVRIYSTAFPSIQSLQGNVNFGRTINRHMSVAASYGYLRYAGLSNATIGTITPSAVRLSIIWTPGFGFPL